MGKRACLCVNVGERESICLGFCARETEIQRGTGKENLDSCLFVCLHHMHYVFDPLGVCVFPFYCHMRVCMHGHTNCIFAQNWLALLTGFGH